MQYDIIIVGGGIVGSLLAGLLAKDTPLSIAILEAKKEASPWSNASYHPRVSAISLASKRIFQSLGVWENIREKRVSPFTRIHVWDAMGLDEIQFDSKDIAESVLGYIIENNAMLDALTIKNKNYSQLHTFFNIKLVQFHEHEEGVNLIAEDGSVFTAKLVIAADGANSWLRSQVGINAIKNDYAQTAIVATVQTSVPHENIARQVFLSTGPLAFLPLNEPTVSSIVWTLPTEKANEVMELDDDQFKQALASAFAFRLGEVIEIEERFTHALYKQHVKQYVKSKIVLVGDTAHIVHPLAGQGLNIGLLDAASLAEIMVEACHEQRDFASISHLRRYERWRKADNLSMLSGISLLQSIFAKDLRSFVSLRSIGLNTINRIGWLKNVFVRHAVGNRSGLPKIALKNNHSFEKV